jgi:dihydroorotase
MANGQWSIDSLIEKLSVAPRKIFGLAVPEIKEGVAANLTLFNPGTEYIFEEGMIKSKSKNSAFVGKQLKGKVIGIVNKNQVVLNK